MVTLGQHCLHVSVAERVEGRVRSAQCLRKTGDAPTKGGSTDAIHIAQLLLSTPGAQHYEHCQEDANHCFVCGPNNPIGETHLFTRWRWCVSDLPDAVHLQVRGSDPRQHFSSAR